MVNRRVGHARDTHSRNVMECYRRNPTLRRAAVASERAADRNRRRGVARRRGRRGPTAVGLRRVLARDLGVRAADQTFGYRVRGRQHREIDLQQRVERVVLLAQCGEQIGDLLGEGRAGSLSPARCR